MQVALSSVKRLSKVKPSFVKNATLKVYEDLPHGMPTTHADIINADMLAFFRASSG